MISNELAGRYSMSQPVMTVNEKVVRQEEAKQAAAAAGEHLCPLRARSPN